MKILLCSSEVDHRRHISQMFKLNGDGVTSCGTFDEASDWAMVGRFDAVIIDPWQNGKLEDIRQVMNIFWHYHQPVIFITARVMAEELKALESLQPNLILRLPEDMKSSLPDRVRALIHHQLLARQG